jgi:protein-S-isoprenylcysteine O-methyltransferase Ste14
MNSPNEADRPNRIPWPPLLYVGIAVGAYLLQHFAPLWPVPRAPVLGWIALAIGLAIGFAGVWRFRTIGTPIDPTGVARELATTGIYARTRNPMYLGATIAFAGASLLTGILWLWLGTATLVPLLRWLAIGPEEAYLERRFGSAYVTYKTKTRRWL